MTNAIIGILLSISFGDDLPIVWKIQLLSRVGFIIIWPNNDQILIRSIVAVDIVVSWGSHGAAFYLITHTYEFASYLKQAGNHFWQKTNIYEKIFWLEWFFEMDV